MLRRLMLLMLFVLPVALLAAPLPFTAPPQPIGYGQTASGQLNAAQPEALYIFSAQAGDVLTITLNRTEGLLDPLLVLIDESQKNVLAVDNDSGGDHNARLRFVIPATARYIIKATAVQGGDLNGSYELALILGNPTATPSANAHAPRLMLLKANTPASSDLDENTRFRLYVLRAEKDSTLNAALTTDSSLQAGLYLYTNTFHELARAELGAPLGFTFGSDGLYLLMVARTSGAGGYTLQATLPAAPTVDTAANAGTHLTGIVLIPGQTQPGTFGERIGALYTFEAQPDTTVDVTLDEAGSGSAAVILLADAALTEIASSSTGQLRGVTLPQAGQYAIFVIRQGGPNDTTIGDYALTLSGTVNGSSATVAPNPSTSTVTEIAYGRTVNDAITEDRPLIFYSFQGVAGEVVSIQMTHISGNKLDPLLYLYSYNNGQRTFMAGSDNANLKSVDAAISSYTLIETGTYLIVATRSGTTTGSFILSLRRG